GKYPNTNMRIAILAACQNPKPLGEGHVRTEAEYRKDAVGRSPRCVRRGRGRTASDWRRAVAVVSERRVAQGRALYTERSPAELYRGARSSERERYARIGRGPGRERPLPAPDQRGAIRKW